MAETIGKNKAHIPLENVVGCTGGTLFGPELEAVGVTTDTRAIEPGNLFVALRGEKFDGHRFLEEAKQRGAIAAVVEEETDVLPCVRVDDTLVALGDIARWHKCNVRFPFDVKSESENAWWPFSLIAITGSYGKTSTRALLFCVLCAKLNTLTSQANFNNEIGVPMTLLQLDETHEAAVIEMGMRGRGQIAYLANVVEPAIGVITNIGPQHIELLGSLEEIALAKAELLENLPENGLAVLPFDSPFLDLLRSKCPCRAITFGTGEGADYLVTNSQITPEGWVEFSIEWDDKSQPVTLRLPGIHNAVNASAAFAVAHQMGIDPESIALALENAELPGARMRVVKAKSGATVLDDCYNAGPDSMRAALQTLLDFPGSGRRVAVLGAMKELGDHSELEHRKIGAFVGQFAELLVGVGGDTRPLLNAAVQAAKEVENEMEVHWFDTAEEASGAVAEMIQENDIILVKGSRSVGLEIVVESMR